MNLASIIAASALACATGAQAQSPTDPPAALELSGEATLVSDYRFRGISETDRRPALQGSVTAEHESGLHATAWVSTIRDYAARGADLEIDLTAGYRAALGGGTRIDVGAVYFLYPGSDGTPTDYLEPYAALSHTLGPATARLGVAYAPRQRALAIDGRRQDNLYLEADLSAGVPGTPVSLFAHIGRTEGPSAISIGDGYTDWSLGATYAVSALNLGLRYVDTDATRRTPRGRNAAGAGVVASVSLVF